MSAEIIPFVFNHDDEETPIRVLRLDGVLWLAGPDTCRALGLKNTRTSLQKLEPDEKGVYRLDTPGGPQQMVIINEDGLTRLVMRSDKERARAFQNWIIKDVIPAIRKTGRYELPSAPSGPQEPALLEALRKMEAKLIDRIGGIEGQLASRWKNFSAQAIRYAFEGAAKYNNCECPYCDTVIVTKHGKPLGNAEVHHGNFNRRDNRPQNCMPACRDCHERVHNPKHPDHIPEHEAVSVAVTFHRDLRRKAGRIRPPTKAVNTWDFRAFTQADMGFPQVIRKRANP